MWSCEGNVRVLYTTPVYLWVLKSKTASTLSHTVPLYTTHTHNYRSSPDSPAARDVERERVISILWTLPRYGTGDLARSVFNYIYVNHRETYANGKRVSRICERVASARPQYNVGAYARRAF